MDTDTVQRIAAFFSKFPRVVFKTDEIIITGEKNPKGIYYIKTGFVRQYSISEQGNDLTIHIYGPQSHFPMHWAINNIANTYYFQAITDTITYLAPSEKVIEFFKNEPQASFEFSKRLLLGIEGLSRRIESIVFGDAHQRVASVLVYLSNHFSEKKEGGLLIRNRFTHDQIATLVGITREHTSLEIEKLEKNGIITYRGHTIFISDIKKLKQIARS